jgi:hypothetical protein
MDEAGRLSAFDEAMKAEGVGPGVRDRVLRRDRAWGPAGR